VAQGGRLAWAAGGSNQPAYPAATSSSRKGVPGRRSTTFHSPSTRPTSYSLAVDASGPSAAKRHHCSRTVATATPRDLGPGPRGHELGRRAVRLLPPRGRGAQLRRAGAGQADRVEEAEHAARRAAEEVLAHGGADHPGVRGVGPGPVGSLRAGARVGGAEEAEQREEEGRAQDSLLVEGRLTFVPVRPRGNPGPRRG
jgi:hypothetical protein